jgi:hypothetical protein
MVVYKKFEILARQIDLEVPIWKGEIAAESKIIWEVFNFYTGYVVHNLVAPELRDHLKDLFLFICTFRASNYRSHRVEKVNRPVRIDYAVPFDPLYKIFVLSLYRRFVFSLFIRMVFIDPLGIDIGMKLLLGVFYLF